MTVKKGKGLRFVSRRRWFSFFCVLPWLMGFVLFTLAPMINTLRYSFSQTKFLPNATVRMTYVGLENYQEVLMIDTRFRLAFFDYLQQMGYMAPMVVIFSMLIAMLLNARFRGRRFFRAVYFLPVVLMQGPLLRIIEALGAMGIPGLDDMFIFTFIRQDAPPMFSAPILYVLDHFVEIIWNSGVQILLCLAGLQKIDRSMYEAAGVDGASAWQAFWKITLPVSRPFLLLSAVYTVVDISTSSANPFISIIKDAMFTTANGFGFSAAVTWLYFLLILVMVGVAALVAGGLKTRGKGALQV